MTDPELERAWRAAEPSPGFADRVLGQLPRVPAPPAPAEPVCRTSWLGWGGRLRWGLVGTVALVVLALAGLWLRASTPPERGGDLIAAEPRVVALGERAVAEMSRGARLRWSGKLASGTRGAEGCCSEIEVQQDRGAVTYRVEPGARFRVQTEHGSVAALGTVFQVIVQDGDEPRGEAMKKQWAIAGATLTLGALLFVSVEQGSVRLWKGDDEVIVNAGQVGSVGADGVPHLGSEARRPAAAPPGRASHAAEEPAASQRPSVRRVTLEARRLRQRVLDSLERREPERSAERANTEPGAARYAPGTMKDRTGELSEEAMRVLNHEFIPLVSECYDQARERNPRLRGMLAVNLDFANARDEGSIVEAVEPAPGRNQLDDEELIECVRQSAFTIQLPLPDDTGRTSRQLTIPLGEPLPPDAGG